MDQLSYRMLRLLRKSKSFPASRIIDKRLYGSEFLNAEDSAIDRVRYQLVKSEYIQQYPAGWYKLTALGRHEYKREKKSRLKAWWLKNYIWICTAIGTIATVITIILALRK